MLSTGRRPTRILILKPYKKLIETYGEEKAAAIDIVLRMIRVGNLLGNTADYVLYRLTFGLLGLRENEAQFSA